MSFRWSGYSLSHQNGKLVSLVYGVFDLLMWQHNKSSL